MSTAVAPAACFGQGESEPYHRALLTGTGTLTLRPEREHEPAGPVESDVRTWCGDASATERSLLQSLRGPVLDVGCGPGRLLAAAGPLGLAALGIDTSAEAVRLAGAAVLAPSNSHFSPRYRRRAIGSLFSCSMATSESEEASPPCRAGAGSSLPRPGRYWWKQGNGCPLQGVRRALDLRPLQRLRIDRP